MTELTKLADPPVCLTIAGLDPSGGAGIIADIKTFSAFGCFAAAAVTSVTFQNTQAVHGAVHQNADSVRRQVEPVVDDYSIAAVKIGMLPTRAIIDEVSHLVTELDFFRLVVDPVVRSTSGFDLIDDEALASVIERLFPVAMVITPNIPEAERITGSRINSEEDIVKAGKKMQDLGAKNVLLKGGHFTGPNAKDFLFTDDTVQVFEAEYINTTATHGTGCTLAAAITANLALGKSLPEAVAISKRFVHQAIETSPRLGKGNSPINI